MAALTVDLRMWNASGIGTYLRNLMPRIISLRLDWRFYLIGHSNLESVLGCIGGNTRVLNSECPIYSVSEQIALERLARNVTSDSEIFWARHYNIPLLYSGTRLVTIHAVFDLAMPAFVPGLNKHMDSA